MTMFFCEVKDEEKVSAGGGVDDEMIEVVEMTPDEARKYVEQERVNSPVGFLFGVNWFLANKWKN